jgi:hypothetical protein
MICDLGERGGLALVARLIKGKIRPTAKYPFDHLPAAGL